MGQKSSLSQSALFVSQALMPDKKQEGKRPKESVTAKTLQAHMISISFTSQMLEIQTNAAEFRMLDWSRVVR
jgi:hypothetical protein